MAGIVELFTANLEVIGQTIAAGIISYVLFYYYFIDLDRKTESFDRDLRAEIREEPALRGIRENSNFAIISTSDTAVSTATVPLRKLRGTWSDVPHEIVPVDGRSPEERQKEVIRIHAREIPGKNIIQSDLVAAIRNYYAYKLALSELGPESEITHHYQSLFDEYDYSDRVRTLARPEHFDEVCIIEHDGEAIRPLDDIFLEVLKGVERYCVATISDLDEQEREMERCREFMMEFFWGLYAEVMKGAVLNSEVNGDTYLGKFREDIRERDNIGYWVLPTPECNQQEFDRFLHIGWNVEQILDEYWHEENFSSLHPPTSSIPEMDFVDTPFLVFRKSLEEFGGGPKRMRIKEDPRYRKKEEFR